MDTTYKSPQVLSLCSGMCGIERGIERAIGKLNVVAYVEIEAFIIQNLTALMEQGVLDAAPVWSDIKTFPAKEFHHKLHGIIGGYPCQPFSVAGKQKGNEDPRHLWPHIQQIIKSTQPVWCFFENVGGHLQLGFDEVYRSLADMGYTIEAEIFTAQEVGAPHQRERLFILAVQSGQLANTRHTKRKGWQTPTQRVYGQQTQPEPAPCSVPGECELEHSTKSGLQNSGQNGERKLSKENSGRLLNRPKQSGNTKLGNTNYSHEFNVSGEQPEKLRQPSYASTKYVPNTFSERLEVREKQSTRKKCQAIKRSGHPERVEGWPLGPGPYQHEWEETRTIESGLGCTAHGYNFREDLLRMYGNGVVEQTAELAWLTLWNKINETEAQAS